MLTNKKKQGERQREVSRQAEVGVGGGNHLPVRLVPQCHLCAFSVVSTPVYMPIIYL